MLFRRQGAADLGVAKVVDLMAALEASLEGANGKQPATKSRSSSPRRRVRKSA